MTSLFLPELCLHKGDVFTLRDMKGRPHTCLLCPMEEDPPHPFHPSLPGPWAQLWPGKGGGNKGGRPHLSFSPYVLIVHTSQILGSWRKQWPPPGRQWQVLWKTGDNWYGSTRPLPRAPQTQAPWGYPHWHQGLGAQWLRWRPGRLRGPEQLTLGVSGGSESHSCW